MIHVNNIRTLVSFVGIIFLFIIQMSGKISLRGLDVMKPHLSWNLVIIQTISWNFGSGLLIEDKHWPEQASLLDLFGTLLDCFWVNLTSVLSLLIAFANLVFVS